MGKPSSRERLAGEGVEGAHGTPAEFAATVKSEVAKWGKVVKASGAKPE